MVRDLREELAGRTIVSVEILRRDIWRSPMLDSLDALLPAQRIVGVDRRGKYILLELHSGDHLMAHLGMTGHLVVCEPDAPPAKHTHFRARLDDGRELRFDDTRRFGRLAYGSRAQLEQAHALPALGVEPLSDEFTPDALWRLLHPSTRTLKAALLDQSRVAGLGNIYIDEACFTAGVRPTRRCNRVTRAQMTALQSAIRATLLSAIVNRGSSVDDYRDVWNAKGTNQERLRVYGRGGQPCLTCNTTLKRTVVAGRTTVYCPRCQR